jgi:hypothetical protein
MGPILQKAFCGREVAQCGPEDLTLPHLPAQGQGIEAAGPDLRLIKDGGGLGNTGPAITWKTAVLK